MPPFPAPPELVLHVQGPFPFPFSWWNVFWNVLPSVKGDLSCSSHILSSLALVLEAARAVSPASVPKKLLPSRSPCPWADGAQMADRFLRRHAFLKHRFLSSRAIFCSSERAHTASSAVCGSQGPVGLLHRLSGCLGLVPCLNRVLRRRAHRRAPCVETRMGLVGFRVLIRPTWPLWSAGKQDLAERTLGHSPGGVWNELAAARAVVCRRCPAHASGAHLCDAARSRRGCESACPRVPGPGSSSLWLWPGVCLAGGSPPPVTQRPEEPANRNLKIAQPGALLRPKDPHGRRLLLLFLRAEALPSQARLPLPLPCPRPATLRCPAL